MPSPIDHATLERFIAAGVQRHHWFGEDVGGSGHLASISPGGVQILHAEAVDHGGKPCTHVTFAYQVIRESEFGGSVQEYRTQAVYDAAGAEMTYEELSCTERDLLNPEPEVPSEEETKKEDP